MNGCSIRKMLESDLEMVLGWRNNPEVRRYMYTTHEILFEEHAKWFKSASCDEKRHLLIFQNEYQQPLGFINIHEIKTGGVSDWGFYLSPDAPKGSGQNLGKAALNYAFKNAALSKVCGQALAFNERSINFHLKLGFKQEGILRQHHFDGGMYHDIYCFGLLSREWHT